MNLFQNWEFDADLRGVGKVTQGLTGTVPVTLVPAYVEADLRIGWPNVRPRARARARARAHTHTSIERCDFSGLNLLHEKHLEVGGPSSQYVPRSFVLSIRQSF